MTRLSGLAAVALITAGTTAHAGVLPHPLQNPSFFPIAVWWQAATETGHSGPYPNIAAAVRRAGINIMLGQGANWPEAFGADQGEFEAIQQNDLYLIGGIQVPWNENNSNLSVASILSLAQSIGAENNLIGYNAGDEPNCDPGWGQTPMSQVPSIVDGIKSFDSTRIVTFNETDWMMEPQWQTHPTQCLQWDITALQKTSVGSFDVYPLTAPYISTQLGVTGTDYKSTPNDSLWIQGISVQALKHFAQPGQPLWAYIEAGGDNFGFSEQNANMSGTVSAGSSVLVSASASRFTSSWIGLTVSGGGLPSGTIIQSVIDGTHALLSQTATASATGESIAVSGGTKGDCLERVNLCVVNGNEYRPLPSQVAAEVWMSIINGATGIEYFCHDSVSYSFCLDDTASGGARAKAAFLGLKYIDRWLSIYARVLNSRTVAQCSMDQMDYSSGTLTTSKSCTSDGFALATSNVAVPAAALVKSEGGAYYIFAQSSRRSSHGATYTFKLPAIANKQATIVYDSNYHYDHAHASIGQKIQVNAEGAFSDAIGTNDDYQTKIYRVEQ